MEYISNCPVCKRHSIIETTKQLHVKGERFPQREAKCVRCGKTARETIIGEVLRVPNYSISATPEFATHDRILIHFWN